MDDKNKAYWELHKQIWQEEFDKLDKNIQRFVIDNPEANESKRLDDRVESIISKELTKKTS
ncbi:MAG: hypothetical protein CMG33_02650 [Candidatus Marinimicrobia bacterium]|jgi:hypothetical protein|nr:hypothetical protein [Candidatus Neomarinimicrobiota bacterium]|tara:strand:- start:229 stop:411 length:183 start_codon:yes stop_codon:yes gene_type:complete